jgi:hypothetical protein
MASRQIVRDFFRRRLSVLGLARKYGMRVREVEAVIRKVTRRPAPRRG